MKIVMAAIFTLAPALANGRTCNGDVVVALSALGGVLMALKTTCIGAYPKPDYVPVMDWFDAARETGGTGSAVVPQSYQENLAKAGDAAEGLFRKAAAEVIADQVEAGIDIVTDGEVRRENYIHYHCRHLTGFDFENLERRPMRNAAMEAELPAIRAKVAAKPGHFLPHDFKVAQETTDHPVKVTVPGPLTIIDTTADCHYGDRASLHRDLGDALNHEVRALAAAGCKYIQIDEPLFARKPDEALAFGIEGLERCFHGVGDGVTRVMHMCCGYPEHLDDEDYQKADPASYLRLADAVDAAAIDQISLEDAHRHNDLSLLDRFQNSTVIFGVVAIARSRIETVEEIRERLIAALGHIDADRLVAAPDCGLGYLTRDMARAKLTALTKAAKSIPDG